ncbi:hypothetical protein [Kitasatospora sp. NPDC059571]|uniref:hypothetical protein n=1 Tax=Kitasatospora sp. NPDC059571 TaxID=3346871 RepID=UPI0036C40941
MGRYGTAAAGMLAAGAAAFAAGCSGQAEAGTAYASDYANHRHLKVVGYPAVDTLQLTQQAVWRMADGETERLAALAGPDGSADEHRATAANWVAAFGRGARGEVTAEFYDAGEDRQTVVLYFHDTGQVKDFRMRLAGHAGADGMRLSMREADPGQASAAPTWAPSAPGAGDSGRIG